MKFHKNQSLQFCSSSSLGLQICSLPLTHIGPLLLFADVRCLSRLHWQEIGCYTLPFKVILSGGWLLYTSF